jgi:hypothetical protein
MPESAFHRLWLVGFAGHRLVGNPEAAKAALRSELDAMAAALTGEIVGISSAAAGADLLFLEACQEAGFKTIVILPFNRSRFAEDFEDPAEWQRASRLIDSAWWHEEVTGNEEAPAAYHVVARELLNLSDRMILLWDGQPARGLGGTGETVADAEKWQIPSRIIDATTLEARWQSATAPQAAAEAPFKDLPPVDSIRSLFMKLDQRAVSRAPRSRWFNAGSMSVNHIATFLQASLLALSIAKEMGGLIKFTLALIAAALPWVGARMRLQHSWVTDRTRAELLRSLLVSHEPASPLHPPALELFENHASFLRSASLPLVAQRKGWSAARDTYLTDRIDDQIRYLTKQGDHALRRLNIFNRIFQIASLGAMLLGAATIFIHLNRITLSGFFDIWAIGFFPAILPGLAAWSLAMISVFEFKRRARMYGKLVTELTQLRPKLAGAECASATASLMRRCEHLLIHELWEWQGSRGK